MTLHPGRWWHREGEQVVCDLCPRRCRLKPGQRGFCFVRQADENGMQLTTWGRSSGFCIDPIEKKPLDHYLPGTPVLSFGTAGCNLGCRFCQNWDVSKAKEMDRLMDAATPEMIADAAVRTGCRSVAYTYNDPVIFAEYALDVAGACRERGIRNVAVSAGYITDEARPEFFRGMDAANIDLKGFTERFYQKLCFGRLGAVQDTLRYLVKETSVWTEITTLLIPEENDGDAELDALSRWVMDELGPDVPLHFTAYHPDYKLDRPPTPPATLTRARTIARANGLRFVYTGNVHDSEGGSTYCPACGNTVVGRDWFRITRWDLAAGACGKCGQKIPGHFEYRPGTWGAKRQPIRLAD